MAECVLETTQEVVHKVQRERGVTCGWVASGGTQFCGLLQQCRARTDGSALEVSVMEQLNAIRCAADSSVDQAPPSVASNFFTIFSDYNSLIARLLRALEQFSGSGARGAYVAFAHLKEATGIERAFLCGALALPTAALTTLPSRAFAQLVLGLEQQKVHEQKVRQLAPPKLLDLIRVGFEFDSDELREVQRHLMEQFDVSSLRSSLSAERCWALLTEHIDKLETLQQLLLAEVRPLHSVADENSATAALQQCLRAIRGSGAASDARAVAESLSAVPANELKAAMIGLLMKRASAPVGDTPTRRQCKRLNASRDPNDQTEVGADGRADDEGGDGGVTGTHRVAELDHLRVSLEQITFVKRIGTGSAGTTYAARWQGSMVAVKVAAGNGVDSWRVEVRALTRLRHPNIVHCLGILIEPPTYGLVLELCHTDLSKALLAPTPPRFLLTVAEGICSGMLYLHAQVPRQG